MWAWTARKAERRVKHWRSSSLVPVSACQDEDVLERVRPAMRDDQAVIARMVHQAGLNPRSLDWHAFVIAEVDDEPVGVAQVRRHSDGSRELASLVVMAEHRGRGIAGRMIDALLSETTDPVFTLLDRRYAGHFTRWDFQPIAAADLPRSMRRQLRIGQLVTGIGSVVRRQRIRLLPMYRPPRSPGPLT
jgi:N-acetylglutamate synthase-like GNAT family acetyltransferase